MPAPRDPEHGPETLAAAGSPFVSGTPLRQRPWAWGLAGVLVTSAVWAGGLWAYDRAGPDLQGYEVSRNLCLDAELPALSASVGEKSEPYANVREDQALDQATCMVTFEPKGQPKLKDYPGLRRAWVYAEIRYTLHKKTDPGPQFDASLIEPGDRGSAEQTLKLVPDVGERAYLVSRPGGESPALEVLDGQAVLSLSVGQVTNYENVDPLDPDLASDEKPVVHLAGLEPAMVEDMLALMDALKKR
ncbi:hypothetical protein [Streptomyces sp. NBC_01506]|uniref:hypothetical protein n=1 Tax=Streptomyces sp. NBC_01506 TaxID=2903887 RepID=UPI0038658E47